MRSRRHDRLDRILARVPWATPLLALLLAVAIVLGLGVVAGRLSPRIPVASTPQPEAALPSVQSTPVPINYSFYDWQNVDFRKQFPGAGPLGSLAVIPWGDIHVNDNQFDWHAIDDYLNVAQKMTITLDSGLVISKPVVISIIDNESVVPNLDYDAPFPQLTPESPIFFFADYTPSWIKDRLRQPLATPITWVKSINPWTVGKLTDDRGSYMAVGTWGTSPCGFPVVAVAPKYNNPTWQLYYKQMVYALGARYDKDPRVAAFVFGPGIDGEFGQATKPFWGCDLKSMLYKQTGMSESEYLSLVVKPGPLNDIADWYHDAFPTKPVYLQFTGAGKSVIDTLNAEGMQPAMGLKQATLIEDSNNQWQSDGAGTLQLMMRYSTTNPIAWENAQSYTGGYPVNMQVRYFTLLAGLMSFPDFMDFIGGWPTDPDSVATGMFDFQRQYLGRQITTTDEIWVAMRDTVNWPPSGGAIIFGGWHGDFTYGLSRPDGLAGNLTQVITTTNLTSPPFSLPYPITTSLYSLIARRTDMASGNPYMSFAADHRWQFWGRTPQSVTPDGVWYDITLKYVDLGSDPIALEYVDYGGITRTRTIRKHDSRQWITTTLTLKDAYLHGQFPGGNDFRLSAVPDQGGADEIVHMIMVKAHAGAQPTPTPALERATRTPLPLFDQRVNAGGGAYVDTKGNSWAADQPYTAGGWGYVGGSVYTATGEVQGVADPTLYKTERWWSTQGSYKYDVPNGPYEVELLFAETLRNSKDQRWFDVVINGLPVLKDYDIFAQAGYNKGYSLTFQTVVNDGHLTIDFIARRDSAKVNAIRVTYLNAPIMSPTPAATPTAAGTATATGTPQPTGKATATGTPTATLTVTGTPTATGTPTPTWTVEQRLTSLEDRFLALDDLVQQILRMMPQ